MIHLLIDFMIAFSAYVKDVYFLYIIQNYYIDE